MHRTFYPALMLLLLAPLVVAEAPATRPADPTADQTRAAFLKLIERPAVDAAPEQASQGVKNGLEHILFSYNSEAGQRVPGLIVAKPEVLKDGKRHAAVIVLHGTGGKKESEAPTLEDLAGRNFISVAIDARYHGERGSQKDYNDAIAKAFKDGKSHPLYLDTVWDQMRLIDYLQTRADVDGNRIGMIGFSKGGIESWLTAAVDPRVKVVVPCISVQSFQWGMENDRWHFRVGTFTNGFTAAAKGDGIETPDAAFVKKFYDHLLPGIYSQFDGPKMLPLIAPRPMLVVSGDRDPINPIEGLHLCQASTTPVYAAAHAEDKFKVIVEHNTAHAVTREAHAAAIDWLDKWLNDPAVQ